MVRVTRQVAERIAELARLLIDDEGTDTPLQQLAELALELVPGSSAAGVVAATGSAWIVTGSPAGIAELHRQQLESGGGPLLETIRSGEARRIDDVEQELRWPGACRAMAGLGLRSCLIVPVRTDRRPGGALAVYGRRAEAFAGSGQDMALLFAAQGGVAVRNAAAYRGCRDLVTNLNAALESRAVIEQAKGILVAEHGCDPEKAFRELSRTSQRTNRKVRDIAADLVAGRIDRGQFRPAGDS
jgi:GAF domain-containing protein